MRYDVFEAPAIAYSDDRGRTWEKLNTHVPLIDPAPSGQLKDVKIFWHKPDKKWIMVSTSDVLRIFSSPNLLEWTPESDIVGVRSSCPDLFELPIDNDNSNTKWVLSLAGRSYHLGSFDGHEFKVETPAIPMNHGPDAFASQTWSDTPDGRRIILDWMMNWSYARRLDIIPTRPWNGAMSLPRSLSLKTTSHGLRLFQNPIEDISQLHTESSVYENLQISANRVFKPDLTGTCVDIEAEIELRGKTIFGIHIAESNRTKYVFNHSSHDIDGERTTISYDLSKNKLNLDRRTSGTIYDKDFASEYSCTLVPQKDRITLRILLDWSSVEVFANNGELVLSALIFPTPFGGGITIFVERGEILIHQLKIHKIRSVWD